MHTESSGEAYEIKYDPGFIRRGFEIGRVVVIAYIIDPITRKWKYHKMYGLDVDTGETKVVTVSGGSL